jgi:hypothetical protein
VETYVRSHHLNTYLVFDANGHSAFDVLHNLFQGLYMGYSKVGEILDQIINNKITIWFNVNDGIHQIANHLKIRITLKSHVFFFNTIVVF